MPRQVHVPTGFGHAKEEAAPTRARCSSIRHITLQLTMCIRFMRDKIMPLSSAADGYEIFDKMKVQKVIFKADE
jgi:hypothetical protein